MQKLNQAELEQFVKLWQDPETTVTQVVAELYSKFHLRVTPREATLIASEVREQLRALDPPVELLDKRRKVMPNYEILARVAREAKCS